MIGALKLKNTIDGATDMYKKQFAQKKHQRQQLTITMFFTHTKKKDHASTCSTETQVTADANEDTNKNRPLKWRL